MVPGPRIRGSTSDIVVANTATSPRKPKTRSFQVARLAASHQITRKRQQSIGPIMATIQYLDKPPSRNAGTNRATIIKATRITAGQTRRARKTDDLTGELDSVGAASAWSLMVDSSLHCPDGQPRLPEIFYFHVCR